MKKILTKILICVLVLSNSGSNTVKAEEWDIDSWEDNYLEDYYDYELKIDSYNKYVLEKVKDKLLNSYFRVTDTKEVTEIVYKEEELNNKIINSNKVVLAKASTNKNTTYYIPINSITKANEENASFVINYEDIEILLSNKFLDVTKNQEIINAKRQMKNNRLNDLYVRIVIYPNKINFRIRNEQPITDVIELDVDIFGFNNEIKIFDSEMEDYLQRKVNTIESIGDSDNFDAAESGDFESYIETVLEKNIWETRDELYDELLTSIELIVYDEKTGKELEKEIDKVINNAINKHMKKLKNAITKEISEGLKVLDGKGKDVKSEIYRVVDSAIDRLKVTLKNEMYKEVLKDIRQIDDTDDARDYYTNKTLKNYLNRKLDKNFTYLEQEIYDKMFYDTTLYDYIDDIKDMSLLKNSTLYVQSRLNTIADNIAKEYMKEVSEQFRRELRDNKYYIPVMNFDAPVLVSKWNMENTMNINAYEMLKTSWSKLKSDLVTNKIYVFINRPMLFVFTKEDVRYNNFENMSNDERNETMLKYNLYDEFKVFGIVEGNKLLTKNELTKGIGSILGYEGNNVASSLRNIGIKVPIGNTNEYIYATQSDLVKMVMGIYELKTGTAIKSYQIKNFNEVKQLKNVKKNVLKEYEVAVEIGILSKEDVDGNKVVTLKEFVKIISNLDKKVGGF